MVADECRQETGFSARAIRDRSARGLVCCELPRYTRTTGHFIFLTRLNFKCSFGSKLGFKPPEFNENDKVSLSWPDQEH